MPFGPAARFRVLPTHLGLLLDAVAGGLGLTVTAVVTDPVQPFISVMMTVYVPPAANVTPVIVGFCIEDVKLLGPVHE